jgi:FkbM family methyltransferase
MGQVRPRLLAVRGGLHPLSGLRIALGDHRDVRLRGVRIAGPDPRVVAHTAVDVAAGEYAAPGFEIRAGDRVVDCGANVGAFAVWAAKAGGTVEAYEPHPETFGWLRRNTAGLTVRCIQAGVVAVPPSEGTVRLEVGSSADTQHTLGGSSSGGPSIEVPAVPLADAIGEGCDLLKIDTEGAEFDLLGATPDEALRRARRIACEVHDWHGDPAELERRLRDVGYAVRRRAKANGLSMLFARL